MRLRVLSSGSKANGYVLYNDREALVIECGCTYSQCLQAVGFRRELIVGALVTHEHGDHCKYVSQYLEGCISVHASKGTIAAMKVDSRYLVPVESLKLFSLGGFRILPFDTQHDCAEPFGYLIHHEEMGQVLFATDTFYLKYKFSNLSYAMVECNYSTEIIERNVAENVIPAIVKERVFRSHMSLDTCIRTLQASDLTTVNAIVLLHLSGNNSDADAFKKAVEEATGKLVFVAAKGLDISFNKQMI
jgi:phosphoribosyl 1,2-cyclic phosphodiesterase